MFNKLLYFDIFMYPKAANMTCNLLILHMVVFISGPVSIKKFQKNVYQVDNIMNHS